MVLYDSIKNPSYPLMEIKNYETACLLIYPPILFLPKTYFPKGNKVI